MDIRFAVLRHLKALSYHDLSDAAHWLHEDFQLHSPHKRFSGPEVLHLWDAVFDAFPDLEIIASEPIVRNGLVELSFRVQGHHTNTLVIDLPGLKPVAPTQALVALPEQKLRCRVENDRIAEVFPETAADCGLLGLMKQLGASLPPTWWLKVMWTTNSLLKKRVAAM